MIKFLINFSIIVGALTTLYMFFIFITKGNRDFFQLYGGFYFNFTSSSKEGKKNDLTFIAYYYTTNMKKKLSNEKIGLI